MKSSYFKVGAGILVSFALLQGFQNCAPALQMSGQSDDLRSVETPVAQPVDHPGGSKPGLTSQHPLMANRKYVAALIEDVFTFSGMTDPQFNALRAMVNAWVNREPGLFGYPCDPKFEEVHCNGTILAPMDAGANSLRTAYKMQLCRAILDKNEYVEGLMVKVAGSKTAAPTETAVTNLYELFYRGDSVADELVSAFLASDKGMLTLNPKISVIDRWRYLTLAICDSSGWELL
ncbi:hypothetical protein [Bdellovibrio bacteriovorus]|uniref:hypothetical protein n=1 Tax=Bdellovibrio bacteriovorus TaxID=959 RepID=UPI0005A05751|nr:hypothetical protein [Bdellovibrio bacteriovorus]